MCAAQPCAFTNLKDPFAPKPGLIEIERGDQEKTTIDATAIERRTEDVMNGKYNRIVDNAGVRVTLKALVFGLWLVACAILLSV